MAFPSHIEIAGRRIGAGEPCLIIAEAGVNHFGDLDKGLKLVDLAVEAGADVFKTQHYRTELLVGPSAPEWRDRLRSKELPDAAIRQFKNHCEKRGILFLCTPHDEGALDFLDGELDVAAFKIGSGEVENWPFLASVASRAKPVILSTGMYDLKLIRTAVDVMADNGCTELALLHCITHYPADPAEINLDVMRQIREFFPGPVGYSDHTEHMGVPLAAVALGADIIEKHITIDRDVPNAQDWKVSCDPSNLADFVRDIREVEAARGGARKCVGESELAARQWARKSLTARVAISAGTKLDGSMLVSQRPGSGLPASQLPMVVGRRVRSNIPAGTPLQLEMLD